MRFQKIKLQQIQSVNGEKTVYNFEGRIQKIDSNYQIYIFENGKYTYYMKLSIINDVTINLCFNHGKECQMILNKITELESNIGGLPFKCQVILEKLMFNSESIRIIYTIFQDREIIAQNDFAIEFC